MKGRIKELQSILSWLTKRGKEPRDVKQDKTGYYIKVYLPKKWQ